MTEEIRSNIYKIVDNTRTPNEAHRTPHERLRGTPAEKVKPFFQTPLRALRWLSYYMLMWIRPFFQLLTRIIAVPAFLMAVLGFIINDPKYSHVPIILLMLSFGSFLLGWFYDTLILKIAPEPVTLM